MALSPEFLASLKENPLVFLAALYDLSEQVDLGIVRIRLAHEADPKGAAPLDAVANLVEGNNNLLKQVLEAFGVPDPRTVTP